VRLSAISFQAFTERLGRAALRTAPDHKGAVEHRTRGLSRSWAAIHRHRRVAHNRMVPERTWCLVRRARFFIFAPDSQAKHACRQAEIPLSPLFKIPGPPQPPAGRGGDGGVRHAPAAHGAGAA
jgi:hypothetical protein